MSSAYPTLYIKNLTPRVTDKELSDLFTRFDTFDRAMIKRDRNGRSLKYGLAFFMTAQGAMSAVDFHKNTMLDEQFIQVTYYVRNRENRTGAPKIPCKQLRERQRPPFYEQIAASAIGSFHVPTQQITYEMLFAATPVQQHQVVQAQLIPKLLAYVKQEDLPTVLSYMKKFDNKYLFSLVNKEEMIRELVQESMEYMVRPRASRREILEIEDIEKWKKENPTRPQTQLFATGNPQQSFPRKVRLGYLLPPRYGETEQRRVVEEDSEPGPSEPELNFREMSRLVEMETSSITLQVVDKLLPFVEKILPNGRHNGAIAGGVIELMKTDHFRRTLDFDKFKETVIEMASQLDELLGEQPQTETS